MQLPPTPDLQEPTGSHPPQLPPSSARWRGAVRWFAAEFLVVVSGILVALAANSVYEARQKSDREAAYLRQLAADLRETERLMTWADSVSRTPEIAGVLLVRGYHAAVSPDRDSILAWYRRQDQVTPVYPITATAQALISTGDLNLLRNDSLRSSIAAYLEYVVQRARVYDSRTERWIEAGYVLRLHLDPAEVTAGTMSQAQVDSAANANPMFRLPPGPRTRRFPAEVEALLQDREAYNAFYERSMMRQNMRTIRADLREHARALREQVERELSN
jgi:hypothetical protein